MDAETNCKPIRILRALDQQGTPSKAPPPARPPARPPAHSPHAVCAPTPWAGAQVGVKKKRGRWDVFSPKTAKSDVARGTKVVDSRWCDIKVGHFVQVPRWGNTLTDAFAYVPELARPGGRIALPQPIRAGGYRTRK